MSSDSRLGRYFFNPVWPILLYLFMAVTTLHMEIPFLLKIHLETIALAATLMNTAIYAFFKEDEKFQLSHSLTVPILLGLLFIIGPLITSLLNQDQLQALNDDEYKDLFKMILFGPCLYFFLSKKDYKDIILNSMIVFYVIFGLYFLYRFLILHEVRDFDQRPLLKIRHGDANFLCTFFSMMLPLPLMQAWISYNKKQLLMTSAFLLAAFFLFICAFLTESRMGLIAIVVGIIYLLTRPILPVPKSILVILFFFFSTIILAFNGERLLSRFADIQDKSNTDRYLTWQNGLQVFKDNPIVGAGMHKAKDFFYQNTTYPPFQSEFKQLEVHNTFLKVAAELGLIGLFFFMIFFLWPWKKSLELITEDRYFLLCSMAILTISILTIGLVYKDLFILHIFVIAALAHLPTIETFKN